MTIKGIKLAVVERLAEKYPDTPCYGIETLDGYQRPCFFIWVKERILMETVNYRQKQCEVEIVRVQRETDEEDSAEFFENITYLFSPKIQIEERLLNTENIEFSFLGENEDIPEAAFEFEYCETIPQETAEVLKEVILNNGGIKWDYQH